MKRESRKKEHLTKAHRTFGTQAQRLLLDNADNTTKNE
jgi:hypothetical protein